MPEKKSPEKIDNLNQHIVQEMPDDGYAMVVSTFLKGRMVLRMCPINPRTTEYDIEAKIKKLDDFAKEMECL